MNIDAENLARTVAEDRATAIHNENGGIDAIRFANGSTIGWRCPGDSNDRETHLGARLARTVAKAHAEIAKVQEDSTRSDAWKADQVQRITAETIAKFEAERAEADALIADFAEADMRESVPPPLAPGDAVGAMLDREDRDEVRKMDREAQTELAQALLDGKHPDILASLLRSRWPLPPVLAAVVNEAYQRQQLASDPQKARQRQRAVDRVQWLREVTEQAQGALPHLVPTIAQMRNNEIARRS